MKISFKKILFIFVGMCIFILFGTSSVFADTIGDLMTEFGKQENIRNFKQHSIVSSSLDRRIDVTVEISESEDYSNFFIFEDDRCKFVLKGQDDQVGLKLARDMWFAIVDFTVPNNQQGGTGTITNTETGEVLTEEEAKVKLWDWVISQVE